MRSGAGALKGEDAAGSSIVNVEAALKAAGRVRGPGLAAKVDALQVREVDGLVSRLLEQIEVPFTSLSKKVMGQLGDMKQVLSADYHEAPGLPPKPLVTELAQIVDREIKKMEIWREWENQHAFGSFMKRFGPREIKVKAAPYRQGAGLALRGFFCRANVGNQDKFLIFLNTAHHPGAVAATFGHELGHYLYGSLVGEDEGPMTAFMEGTFGAHLEEQHELFADALVALAAYNTDQIKAIVGRGGLNNPATDKLLKRVHKIYEMIGSRLKLDLKKQRISASWRVSYLTSMIHFFKLRCALLDIAQV